MADIPHPDVEVLHTDDVLRCNLCGHPASHHRFASPVICAACPGEVCAPSRVDVHEREVDRG